MKFLKVLLLSLCLLTLVPQLALGQNFNAKGRLRKSEGAIRNNYIVVFDESLPSGRVQAFAAQLAREHGGKVGFTYESALRGFSVEMNEAQAEKLSQNPHVAYVEEDALVEGASTQTGAPWGLDRIDQRSLPLDTSYTYLNSGTGANVYVIDGGIRLTHQEFGGRAAFAYDNVGDGRNGVDCNGHGTHVAGIIGGKTYGVAKDAKLWSVRVLNCLNQGTTARIIAGVDWVAANRVKPAVANLSFITIAASDTIDLAVRNLIASGVTTVVAAGNNTGDASLRSPARVTEAITVAATDQNDNQAPFSNFGSVVDVYAPGVDIVSASSVDDASTAIRSGTSSAAPFVAGSAARYLSANPGESIAAVSRAITANATPGKVSNAGAGTPNLVLFKPNSKVAFSSQRDGNWEIYVMDPDGSNQTNVTLNVARETTPVWSPDGRKIAFTSDRASGGDIYVVNTDGSGLTRLTASPASGGSPTWSPDSKRIAFSSGRDGNGEVYVMNADGTNQVNLTRSALDEFDPVWSPNGQKIAFRSRRDGSNKIYVMNADGTNPVRLINNMREENTPVWSPDSQKLAFDSYYMSLTDGMEYLEVWVVNSNGTGATNLTPLNASGDYQPDWSPDGKKLAISSSRYGGSQYGYNYPLYTINPDGTNAVRLTLAAQNYFGSAWAPGGDRIAVMGAAGADYNNQEIFVVNADGSNLQMLTNNPAPDYYPEWQPM
ncbi:MAG TPA: S8 family serine peptidase [Pyrinomonadaceae bacterium]|jgi:Tol biopolymer transport system component|nr:S8 family serine peptidase [Pyrinomonadaceae bacterium]